MHTVIKILFCEDNLNDVELMKFELDKANVNYHHKLVETKEDFILALHNFIPDIILCDYNMPSFNGMDAFKILKETKPGIPFIVVTGSLSEELALAFLNEGVDDFILKSSFWRVSKAIKKAIEKKFYEKIRVQSEANLKVIFDNTSDGFILTDENYQVKSFNNKAKELVLIATQENIKLGDSIFDYLGESLRALLQKKKANGINEFAIQFGRSYKLEGNVTKWLNYSVNDVIINQQPMGVCITVSDFTTQKLAEGKILKANRMYAFISQINQAITQVADLETLLKKACTIAIDYGRFKMAWVMLINQESKKLHLLEESGTAPEDLNLIKEISYGEGSPTELILQSQTYYLCNDVGKEFRNINWKTLGAKRGIFSFIVLPIKKSGIIIGTYSLFSTELNFFDQEEITLLQEVANDISFAMDVLDKVKEHKKAEEKIIENEKRFRALIEKGTDMIALSNVDGKMFYSSPSITLVLGYSAHELVDLRIQEKIHPDDLAGFVAKRTKAIQIRDSTFQHEMRIQHKQGEWIWCEGTFKNMLLEPGINALVSNVRDISSRKKTEVELRLNIRAINNAEEGILITNVLLNDNPIIFANHGFYSITGYKQEEVLGKNCRFLQGKDTDQNTILQIKNKIEAKEHFDGEILNYKKDGTPFWNNLRLTPVPDAEGNITHFIGFQSDVTTKKNAEKESQHMNEQLRQLSSHIQNLREKERTDIAREIHDELGQQLTSLKMDASWLKNKTEKEFPQFYEKSLNMIHAVNETIQTVRRIATELRPGVLDDFGLVAALEWQMEEFKLKTGFTCSLVIDTINESFERDISTTVFRIFQESLTNITRHANATEVKAKLYEENNFLVLEIIDNGKGISEARLNNKISLGILGMKERAFMHEGTLSIFPLTKGGTGVTLKIPLKTNV